MRSKGNKGDGRDPIFRAKERAKVLKEENTSLKKEIIKLETLVKELNNKLSGKVNPKKDKGIKKCPICETGVLKLVKIPAGNKDISYNVCQSCNSKFRL